LYDFQNDLNTLPRKMIDALTARVSEVLLPSEIMKEVLGAEPRVRPVLTGLPDKSQLAWVALQADVFCKTLFDKPELKGKVSGYQTYFEWLRTKRQRPLTGGGHLWISPGDFELFESADGNTLRFGRTPMVIHIEKYLPGRKSVPDPQLTEYANLLTACYDDIAREYAVLHQLRECTKMVAAAQWLKKRGFSITMPIEGRERVNLPAELPGTIYMVMAIKQASVGQILMAAGGIDFSGDSGWRYTRREMQSPQGDFVELTIQQTREKVEQIFRKKIDAPVPRPLGEVTSGTAGGRKVTTVTISTASGTSGTSSVRLRRSPEEQAAFLWKSDDLAGAEQAYRKLIESCSGDVRYCASLRMILAQVLHEKGDHAAAIKELNEAVRVAPDLPLVQLLYAKVLFESGDLRGAEETLKRYLALDPNNKAAAKILAEVQARQKRPVAVTSAPSASVPLTPFNQALREVPASSLSDYRAPELRDIRIEPFKASGRDQPRPVQVPRKLAETEGWRKLKAEDDRLAKDYMEIDRKLEEIRDKKGRGEGNQGELDKQESQLKQEQAAVKEKIETLEKEMVGVLVKWEKENPEPPASEPVQPTGDKPSVPKEGEKRQ
jgi:tetratricopeptide (TPR) repeat protein